MNYQRTQGNTTSNAVTFRGSALKTENGITRGLLLHYGPNIRPHQAALSGVETVAAVLLEQSNTLLAPLQLGWAVALGGEIHFSLQVCAAQG